MQTLQRTRYPRASRATTVVARAALQHSVRRPGAVLPDARVARRALLLGAGSWLVMPATPLKLQRPARAEDEAPAPVAYEQLKGYALPPDSYMGYEPNATYDVKYTIDYPSDWVIEKPTKTEKSTMGWDTHVHCAKNPKIEAFVIALSGPDYRGVQMNKDPVAQLKAMATSDFELRDAISNAVSLKTAQTKQQGRLFYFYDLEADRMHYVSAMTVDADDGTMYAVMAKAPTGRAWDRNEEILRHIQRSFTLL